MSYYKIIYIILYIILSIPVLGYGRYLHDDEENQLGAVAVFVLVILTGFGVYKMS